MANSDEVSLLYNGQAESLLRGEAFKLEPEWQEGTSIDLSKEYSWQVPCKGAKVGLLACD